MVERGQRSGRAQLFFVLWKNLRLRRRSKIITTIEVIFPVLFVLIFVVIKAAIHSEVVDLKTYPAQTYGGPEFAGVAAEKYVLMGGASFGYGPANDPNVKDIASELMSKLYCNATRVGDYPDKLPWCAAGSKDGKSHDPPPGMMQPFETEDDLESYVRKTDSDAKRPAGSPMPVWCAVWFTDLDKLNDTRIAANASGDALPFSVRCDPTKVPQMEPLVQEGTLSEMDQNGYFANVDSYNKSGFLAAQGAVQEAIGTVILGVPSGSVPSVSVGRFPRPSYVKDTMANLLQTLFSSLLILTFMLSVRLLVSNMVEEKEKKIREGMKIMGLYSWVNWAGWFLSTMVMLVPTITIVAVLLKVGDLFSKSDFFIIYIFYLLFLLSTVLFAFVITTLFSRARTGAAVGMVLFLFAQVPANFCQGDPTTSASGSAMTKTLVSILSPTAFTFGNGILARGESTGKGVTWSNLSEGQFAMSSVLLMLFIDCLLYAFLAWYLDNVVPGEYGTARKPWFFLTASYWSSSSSSSSSSNGSSGRAGRNGYGTVPGDGADGGPGAVVNSDGSGAGLIDIEMSNVGAVCEKIDPALNMRSVVEVMNLRKVYKGDSGDVVAVKSLGMRMFEGQVFGLLGHNGAGKTTTISMMTGMFSPTEGDATVYGHSIVNDIDGVRRVTGFCPQHDILFDGLTVHESMMLFAGIKGSGSFAEGRAAADEMLREVELEDKRDTLTKDLSGGMKRKLSVALAFIGGSKVVYLDEPTSGVDPAARRGIWRIIEKNRAGRVIVLTTHSMDEANILADRIAIMAGGQLKALGSSLFLKAQFGVGYTLTTLRTEGGDAGAVTKLISGHIPEAQASVESSLESSFVLPVSAVKQFPDLLDALDAEAGKGDAGLVQSYGISVTTLEEVFLDITRAAEAESEADAALEDARAKDAGAGASVPAQAAAASSNEAAASGAAVEARSRQRSRGQQLRALTVKRLLMAKRDKRGFYMQLLMPVMFLLFGVIAIKTLKSDVSTKDQAFSIDEAQIYGNALVAGTDAFVAEHNVTATARFFAPINASAARDVGHPVAAYDLQWAGAGVVAALHDLDVRSNATKGSIELVEPAAGAPGAASDVLPVSPVARFSVRAVHGAPAMLALAGSVVYDVARRAAGAPLFLVASDPLPNTRDEARVDVSSQIGSSIMSIYVVIGFAFIPAMVANIIVKEREVKAKHQQLVSGIGRRLYWVAAYLWDMTLYVVPVVIAMLLFLSMGIDAFVGENAPAVLVLFLAYGVCVFPLTYAVSFFFKKGQTAMTGVLLIYMMTGLVLISLSYTFMVLGQTSERYEYLANLAKTTKYPCFLLPNFALGKGLLDLSFQRIMDRQFENFPGYDAPSAFSWDLLGAPIVFLILETAVYWFLAIRAEFRSTHGERVAYDPLAAEVNTGLGGPGAPGVRGADAGAFPDEDEDVARERRRIESRFGPGGERLGGAGGGAGGADALLESGAGGAGGVDDAVEIVRLRKVYPPSGDNQSPKVAVGGISFGIRRGDCFGLLGHNGAGKTTTMGMITGEHPPTSGTAYLNGREVLTELDAIYETLGYAPQENPLFDLLTCTEHLTLYARIRGLPEDQIPVLVAQMISRADLVPHASKLSKDLSGGNKRKLGLACALIGDPDVLLTDEVSSGVDPVSRRKLWGLIRSFCPGRCVILVTHLLEEAEALCTSLAIMVNGQLRCLGSPQHLRSKFGEGYLLEFNAPRESHDAVIQFLADEIPSAVLSEAHGSTLRFRAGRGGVGLAEVFRRVERRKEELGITEYGVSQPTLEQVFLRFSAEERE